MDPQPAVQIIDLDVEDSEHVPIDVIARGTRISIRAWPGPLDRIAARVAGGLAGEGSTLDGRAVAGLWLCATRADGADTAKWGWRHRKPHSAGGIYPLFAASLCASGAPIILCRTVPTVQATAHRTPALTASTTPTLPNGDGSTACRGQVLRGFSVGTGRLVARA